MLKVHVSGMYVSSLLRVVCQVYMLEHVSNE